MSTMISQVLTIDRSLNYGRVHVAKFLKMAEPYKRVLDLGAGKGNDLLLARSVNPNVILSAIEGYQEYVDELSRKNIHVYCLDIERDALPFSDGEIDVIIMNQILEHTKEVFWIFHEVSRVLPVNGKIILGVPNLAAFHNRILLALGCQPSPIKTNSAHVRGFTKGDVLRFLESGFPDGYTLRGFRGSNFYPFPPLLAKPLACLFPTMAWGIFFLLEKVKKYQNGFLEYPIIHQLETNFYLGKQ